jgi:hypothetical protein
VIIRRRDLILMLAGELLAWPRAMAAQRASVIGFLSSAWPEPYAPLAMSKVKTLRFQVRGSARLVASVA